MPGRGRRDLTGAQASSAGASVRRQYVKVSRSRLWHWRGACAGGGWFITGCARHWVADIGGIGGRRGPGTNGRSMVTVRDPSPAAPAPPPGVDSFYDARRGVYYTKPVLRGWLHRLWFEASLVGGTLLLARVHG